MSMSTTGRSEPRGGPAHFQVVLVCDRDATLGARGRTKISRNDSRFRVLAGLRAASRESPSSHTLGPKEELVEVLGFAEERAVGPRPATNRSHAPRTSSWTRP